MTVAKTAADTIVLTGGPGANTRTDKGTGFKILIGGGPTTMMGNGNDILTSGNTSYNSNTSANITPLDAILTVVLHRCISRAD